MLTAEELWLLSLDSHSGEPMLGSDMLRPALGGALVALGPALHVEPIAPP
jgi:hypothetical protein